MGVHGLTLPSGTYAHRVLDRPLEELLSEARSLRRPSCRIRLSSMFQPSVETMPAEERAALQLERLDALVTGLQVLRQPVLAAEARRRGGQRAPVAAVHRQGGAPRPLPVRDLRSRSPARAHPRVLGHARQADDRRVHRGDLDVFADLNARALAAVGGRPDDVLHVAYGYGLFTGGLGFHYGAERLGATVVPASGGNIPLPAELLEDLGADGLLHAVVRAAPRGACASRGCSPEIDLRFGVFGAEPWSEACGEARAGVGLIDACDMYGLWR